MLAGHAELSDPNKHKFVKLIWFLSFLLKILEQKKASQFWSNTFETCWIKSNYWYAHSNNAALLNVEVHSRSYTSRGNFENFFMHFRVHLNFSRFTTLILQIRAVSVSVSELNLPQCSLHRKLSQSGYKVFE